MHEIRTRLRGSRRIPRTNACSRNWRVRSPPASFFARAGLAIGSYSCGIVHSAVMVFPLRKFGGTQLAAAMGTATDTEIVSPELAVDSEALLLPFTPMITVTFAGVTLVVFCTRLWTEDVTWVFVVLLRTAMRSRPRSMIACCFPAG